jgi:hypothetical protein
VGSIAHASKQTIFIFDWLMPNHSYRIAKACILSITDQQLFDPQFEIFRNFMDDVKKENSV